MQPRIGRIAGRRMLRIGAGGVVAFAGRSSSSRRPTPGADRTAWPRTRPWCRARPALRPCRPRRWTNRAGSCRRNGCTSRGRVRAAVCITSSRCAVRTCSSTPSSSLNSALSVSSSRRAADLGRPVLGVAVIGAAVGDAVAFGDQQVDIERYADMSRRRPSRRRRRTGRRRCGRGRRGSCPAARSALTALTSLTRSCASSQVRHLVADLVQHLRQDAAAHAAAGRGPGRSAPASCLRPHRAAASACRARRPAWRRRSRSG